MSKRKLILPLTSLVILLTSCGTVGESQTDTKDVLTEPFTCTANITTANVDAVGVLTRKDVGNWSIEFSEPSTLSGVTLTFDGVTSEASYKGLTYSMPKDAVPINSTLLCLATAIDEISTNEETSATAKDGSLTFKGSVDGGEYILTVDETTGDLTSFIMDNLELTMTFSNVQPLEIENQNETEIESIETTT